MVLSCEEYGWCSKSHLARCVGKIVLIFTVVTSPLSANAWVTTKAQNQTYANSREAVMDMADQYLLTSRRRDVEFVGGLLKLPDGTIQITVGNGGRGEDSIGFRVPKSAGAEIIGFWHTHGDFGFARNLFSATDAEMVRSTGKPLFLITPHGGIRVLTLQDIEKPMRSSSRGGRRSGLLTRFEGYSGLQVAKASKMKREAIEYSN